MATTKTDAQKVAEYRAIAQDKSKPQEVRDQADMRANEIEKKNVEKAGVKLAKGGAVVAKAPAKKAPMKVAAKQPMKAPTKLAKGGAVKKGKC
jgi:hypothetical protein